MSIEKLPNVTIGNTDKIFGGNIFNLDLDIQAGLDGGEVTTLRVDLASEDGTFQISESDFNLDQHYDVKIGTFALPMYLKTFRKIVSTRGNTLQVEFIDGSFKLDRYWVGLSNVIWDKKDLATKPKWLIVVGREIHPCDRNNDGTVDFKDIIDQCDPCVTEAMKKAFASGSITTGDLQRGILDCKEMSRLLVFDVQYTFDELVTEVKKATGLKLVNAKGDPIKAPNEKYRQKYAGRLREVLRSWAADFGWTFFFTDNSVVFIDATHPIRVKKALADFCPNVNEYTEEFSLEGTFVGNLATHFKRAGEFRNYSCEDARYIVLSPFMPGLPYTLDALQITRDIDLTAAGLCLYSPYLRDLYWWFIKNEMGNLTKVKPMKKIPELGLVVLSDPITLDLGSQANTNTSPFQPMTLEPATRLEYPKDYPFNQDVDKSFLEASGLSSDLQNVQNSILANEDFRKLFELLAPKEQWQFALNAKDYYFFIGYYDETIENKHIEEEAAFASDFVGKYYVYAPDMSNQTEAAFFEDDRIFSDETQCGRNERISDGKLRFASLNRSEDSVEYFNAPAVSSIADLPTLSKMPWARWLKIFRDSSPKSMSQIGDRVSNFKLLTVAINGDRYFPSPTPRSTDDDNTSKYTIQDQELIRQAHSYHIRLVPSKLDKFEDDVVSTYLIKNKVLYDRLDDSVKDTTRIFLFWGRKASKDDFQIFRNGNYFHETQGLGYKFDGIPLNERSNLEFFSKTEIVYKYPQFRCKDMGRLNTFASHVSFKTPVANFEFTEPCRSPYGVMIEKNKNITVRTERAQYFFTEGEEPSNKVLGINVNQYDIGDDDISNRTFTVGTCQYKKDTIKALHDERKQSLTFKNESPAVQKTFTVAGPITDVPAITDGLMSIQMNIDRQEGLKTTFVLGTLKMIVPNQDIYNGLEFKTDKIQLSASIANYPYRQK